MDIVDSTVGLLIFLMPGFIVLKMVSFKCDIKDKGYKFYVLEALIYSVLIYMIVGFLPIKINPISSSYVLVIFLISVLFGILAGEIKNADIILKIFQKEGTGLSGHEKIFYIKAKDKLLKTDTWHVIGLKNGKEICGIVREYNPDNNEMLIEKARWINSGKLSKHYGWLYFPPNDEIEYIISIEKGGNNDSK
ncbi:MAG: hypothetical protein GY950_23210 [bacterium]|nr:hypothetical protein [bacterium]